MLWLGLSSMFFSRFDYSDDVFASCGDTGVPFLALIRLCKGVLNEF